MKEGFKNERLLSLPDSVLRQYESHAMVRPLYLRKIGFFPRVKYHFVQKPEGTDYAMLIYCTAGRGWCEVDGRRYDLCTNSYIILPPHVPYAFGSSDDEPWTIYWLHFRGDQADFYVDRGREPMAIEPNDNSRLQHRFAMFDELYASFSMAYTLDFMIYSSACLQAFLASFVLLPQYRHINMVRRHDDSFSNRVIHYMHENVHHNLRLGEIAEHFHYSQSHFSMLFHSETGISPITYFIRLKVQKACQYIELSDMKLSDIATVMGFDDAAYFTRIFTKVMGVTPSQYRSQET